MQVQCICALSTCSLRRTAGVSGRLWGTFLPAEAPTSDTEAPRGVSILARDMQSVAIYDSQGQFVGIRRPDSGRPIEVWMCMWCCLINVYEQCFAMIQLSQCTVKPVCLYASVTTT
jgi:hypothetical protein